MIKIINPSICETCNSLACSFLKESIVRHDIGKLSTETTVCPTQALSEGPNESELKSRRIEKNCVDCGLCIMHCPHNNLKIESNDYNIIKDSFKNLTETQLKATVMSMLGFIFSFAANTNRNKSLHFDGFICSSTDKKSFVEIDWENDSLKCTRRILGDILTYSHITKIDSGLIVLKEIPSSGNRDVYNVLKKISTFPTTQELSIYITTIPILRWIMLYNGNKKYEISDIGFNPLKETREDFIKRINTFLPDTDKIITI